MIGGNTELVDSKVGGNTKLVSGEVGGNIEIGGDIKVGKGLLKLILKISNRFDSYFWHMSFQTHPDICNGYSKPAGSWFSTFSS